VRSVGAVVDREAAIAGTGFTGITKKSGRSVLDLATEACRAAVEDAGLPLADVDGIGSFMVLGDSVPSEAVATALALPQTRYVMDFQQGGQSPAWVVANAAMAVSQGYAENVVVFRALNGRSGVRVGSSAFLGGAGQFRYPIGYDTYMQYIAMWARRYLIETGQEPDDLGAIPVAQRWYAERNERRPVPGRRLHERGGRRLRRRRHQPGPRPGPAPPASPRRLGRLPGRRPARTRHRRPRAL
jgi:acetyl-CoA acetyltransferase